MRLNIVILSILWFSVPLLAGETTPVVGNIGESLSILDVTNVKAVEQHIDRSDFYKSFMIVEVSGHYEGHVLSNEGEEVYAALVPQTPFNGNKRTYTLELFPVAKTNSPYLIRGGAITAVSKPKEFTKQIKITTYKLEWYTCDGLCTALHWTIAAKKEDWGYNKDKIVVRGTVEMGFRATLRNLDTTKDWLFDSINVPGAETE